MNGDAVLVALLASEAVVIVCVALLPLMRKPTRGVLLACGSIVAASCAKAVLYVWLLANTPTR